MDRFIRFLATFWRRFVFMRTALLWVLLGVIFTGIAYSYTYTRDELTEAVLSKRESVAAISASLVKEQFDHVIDRGKSLSRHPKISSAVSAEKWAAATVILKQLTSDMDGIDRIYLTDAADTEQVALLNGSDTTFNISELYTHVRDTQKPYLSEVHTTDSEEPYKVVEIAFPITDEEGTVVLHSMLVMQIRLDTLLAWSDTTSVGPEGYLFIVDNLGQVAASPRYPNSATLINYSSAIAVQRALAGDQGSGVLFDSFEGKDMLAAYTPVTYYGWGVIVQQPSGIAFAERDTSLHFMIVIYIAIAVFIGCLIYLLTRSMALISNSIARPFGVTENADTASAWIKTRPGKCVITTDRHGMITSVNEDAVRVIGWLPEEIIGVQAFDVLLPTDATGRRISKHETPLTAALESGTETHSPASYCYTTKGGTIISVTSTVTPVVAKGSTIGAAEVFVVLENK